jgi:hypothetical protein
LLEVFKELSIRGDSTKLDTFIDALSERLAPGWARHYEGERRIAEMALPNEERQYAFRCEAKGKRPAVGLFLIRFPHAFSVTNIVPQQSGSLTRAQYNSILDEFADLIARPVGADLGLTIEVTPDRLSITHWLSEEAASRLKSFSVAANKATGSSHPMDFKRWAAFLIQAHRDSADLDSETLLRWLVEEEEWPETVAVDLATEYEVARNLLEAYDATRQ